MATRLFRATREALRRALPGWKTPLEAPVQRQVRNPFTGQSQMVWSWDSTPDVAVLDVQRAAPGPGIDLMGLDLNGVLALLSVLLPDDATALRAALFAPGSAQTHAHDHAPALIGPDDLLFVWAVPSALTSRLSTMTEAEIAATGPHFAARFREELKLLDPSSVDLLYDDFYTDALRSVCALAREAAGQGEDLYEWVTED